MDKEKNAKELGFSSFYEMQLYEDVCTGREVGPPQTLEELLEELQKDEFSKKCTKKDYDDFIKRNGLFDLFNKVKGMSLFDRMVEIYAYNVNGFSLCDRLRDLYMAKLEEAKEIFDGEKECEYRDQLSKLSHEKYVFFRGKMYIETQVKTRLPSDLIKFYKTVEPMDNEIFSKYKDDFSSRNM